VAKISVGDKAPDFGGDSDGKKISLADYAGKKNVVLYFYPGDFTPICTKEACGFRDIYEELKTGDTEIIGVSTDSDESHKKFTDKYHLPFPLLADTDKSIARAYGATNLVTDLLGRVVRVTYVIDKAGKIAAILKSELSANKHVDGVKDALAALK
jgi:peroxiredoxin Q/BCP